MFGARVTLFRLFGFAVRADLSWLIVVALVVASLATGVFPHMVPGLSPGLYWTMGAAGTVVFFLCIVAHEFAHAMVARRFGIPMRGITLFVFGGVAEMDDEPPNARAELLMSAAGPATSVLLGILFFLAYGAGAALHASRVVTSVLLYIAGINIVLAVFNLIPAFPLDGGRVLRSILWWRTGNLRRATHRASQAGSILGFLLIVAGIFSAFTGNLITGIWWFLIGMFVRNAALASYQQLVVRQTLEGEPVSRFMKPDPITVPRWISIEELVLQYVYKYHFSLYPVVDGDRLTGCVTTKNIRDVPREEWERQTVGSIAEPCSETTTIAPQTEVIDALKRMSRTKQSRLIVVQDGKPVGILTLKDLLHFVSVKMELDEAA
ncbi:MAG TPA: site-2 protease family protein [Thermoanaerobaculia bacterium]|nr:site-2 protease family protein [Thermoanaerobaculia bacterium]